MRLELVIEKGGLEANLNFIDFDLTQYRAEFPNVNAIKNAIENLGCKPEFVDESALGRLHSNLNQIGTEGHSEVLEQTKSIIVARGIPAEPEQVEGLIFFKSYVSAAIDLTYLKSQLFQEGWNCLDKGIMPDCVVDKGAKILEYLAIQSGKMGKGIRGEPIVLSQAEKSLPEPGKAILAQPQRWVALKKGFLVLEDNILKIWSPPGDGSELIQISPDKMLARLILRKNDFEDLQPTLELLIEAIQQKQFAFSIAETKLKQSLREFLQENKDQDLVLSKGKPGTLGKNGYQELLVDPEPLTPDTDQSGSVDFKNFSFFRSVKKGDLLGKIYPAVDGELGMDIFGEPIVPIPAIPFSLEAGKNTERKGENILLVTAVTDGRLSIIDGIPEVIETLEVHDNISLKTGNINFPGSVDIQGDLLDNMQIQAKGDVEIAGTVEDGCVTSDGAIIVRGGFTGSGKGVIKSKLSSVTIGHIRNQRIESHSNIIVYNEVVNAKLFAKKSIIMKTIEHSVVGGQLKAFSSIEISNAGSPSGIKTILEVGKDFEIELEMDEKRAMLNSNAEELEFLDKIYLKLQNLGKPRNNPTPEMRLLEQRTKGILQFIHKTQDALNAEMRSLENQLYNKGECFVFVRGNAYPGTILKYQGKTLILNEIAKGKRWIFHS